MIVPQLPPYYENWKERRRERLARWHKWFAWYKVPLHGRYGRYVIFERVWRKGTYHHGSVRSDRYCPSYWTYDYRRLENSPSKDQRE